MELSNKTKLSELGQVPADWNILPIEEVAQIKNGLTYSPSNVSDNGTMVLRSSNIQDDRLSFTNNVFVNCSVPEKHKVEEGDILICVRNGSRNLIGKCALIDKKADGEAFGAFMAVLRSDISDYLIWQFRSSIMQQQINEHLGATINQITNGSLKAFKVILPSSTKERHVIAEALSDADALIASLEKLIEKKSKVQNSLANTLLISSENNDRFTRIDELVSIDTGGRNTQDNKPDGAYPFFVRSQKIERIDSFAYDKEAVLTAGDGVGTGKIFHYINGKFDAHQRVYILSDFRGDVVGRYFYWQFKSRFYERIMSMTAKSSVDSVRREMIADLTLPIPSVSEQKEIVSKLDDAESEMTLLNLQLSKAKKVKAGMMQELLTGRTRLI